MAGAVEARLAALGIELPEAAAPAAAYIPYVLSGSMLYVSGQVPFWNGSVPDEHKGTLGAGVEIEQGQKTARICGLNLIAQVKKAVGDLDRVVQVVKLTGFVNSAPDFTGQPQVVNGCSELMQEVFGDLGKHARSAVGVAALPLGVAVEIEGIFEVK